MISVGEYLRKLRTEKGVSLEDVAKETNIRLNYLQAIENDQTDRIPSAAQAKGFTRLYAAYLGVQSRDVFAEVEKLNSPEKSALKPEIPPPDSPSPVLVENLSANFFLCYPVRSGARKRVRLSNQRSHQNFHFHN